MLDQQRGFLLGDEIILKSDPCKSCDLWANFVLQTCTNTPLISGKKNDMTKSHKEEKTKIWKSLTIHPLNKVPMNTKFKFLFLFFWSDPWTPSNYKFYNLEASTTSNSITCTPNNTLTSFLQNQPQFQKSRTTAAFIVLSTMKAPWQHSLILPKSWYKILHMRAQLLKKHYRNNEEKKKKNPPSNVSWPNLKILFKTVVQTKMETVNHIRIMQKEFFEEKSTTPPLKP